MTAQIVFTWIENGLDITKYSIYAKFVRQRRTICAVELLSRPTNQIAENRKYMYVMGTYRGDLVLFGFSLLCMNGKFYYSYFMSFLYHM